MNFLLHYLDKIQFGHRVDTTLEAAQSSRKTKANENPDQRIKDLPAKKL